MSGKQRIARTAEEADRYEQYEAQVQEFIAALLALRAPTATAVKSTDKKAATKPNAPATAVDAPTSPALRAALAAAALGLYQGPQGSRQAYGLELLGKGASADDQTLVLEQYGKRHLLLL